MEMHFHNDLGMAVACSVEGARAALDAGVDAYINRMKMEMTLGGQKFYRYPEVLRVDDKDINFGVANGVVRGKP